MIPFLALAGILAFLVGISAVEAIRRHEVSYKTSWISTYIQGPYSWIEDLGFAALAGSLELLPHVLNLGLVQTLSATVGGVALVMVVVTRKYFHSWFPSLSGSAITRMHVLSAGLAFAGAAIAAWDGEYSIVSHGILIATGIACAVVAFMDDFNGSEIAEKLGALGVCLAALADIFPRL